MRTSFLPFALPDTDDSEIAQMAEAVRSGWVTTGPKTRQFEAEFAACVGAKYAIAVNSCTAAMHLALEAAGLGPGDLVLTTPYTFAATAEVIRYFNATPLFVDVEPDTLNINPALVAQAVEQLAGNKGQGSGVNGQLTIDNSQLTIDNGQQPTVNSPFAIHHSPFTIHHLKALLPVHFAGLPADLDPLYAIAARYRLAVIEDAAHAFPAAYKGRIIGSSGAGGWGPGVGDRGPGAGDRGPGVGGQEAGVGGQGPGAAASQSPSTNGHPPTLNLQPSTSNLQPPTPHLQPPTSHLQPSTSNLQPPTSHLPPSTFNLQPSHLQPSNLQPSHPPTLQPSAVCFSFYATKTLTTGEGGMICTDNEALAERCRIMALHGISKDAWKRYTAEGSWYYEIIAPGYKYNMTDVAAAMGLAQLAKAERMWQRRWQIAMRYNEAFAGCLALQVPADRAGCRHAWHLYVLRLNVERLNVERNEFIEGLKARNIGASVHFIPLHLQPYYRDTYGYAPGDFPVAYQEFQRVVSLPIYSKMSDQDVSDVIEAVLALVRQHARPPAVWVKA